MCHVLWAWTTGDAVGANMMTRNSYALNMGFVMERAPVRPERAILEANMGGDKKPSHRYFERGGHGKTVLAECTLSENAVRRVLRTTDCIPDATAPCVPAHESSSRSSTVGLNTRRTAFSESVHSANTVLPWPPRSK